MKRAIVFAVILMCAPLCLATTIHVPADQPTIQAGIDAAVDGDTVLISDGRYYERINYRGKNIVVGSQFLNDGDTTHITNTILDGDTTVLGVSDSGSVVSFVNGEDSTAVLAGMTIVNGIGLKESPYGFGGGIICRGASPRVEDCLFAGNHGDLGGAIFSGGAPAKIRSCIFKNNSAIGGGALYSSGPAINVEDCRFVDNQAYYGGAVIGVGVDVVNCFFLRNWARDNGGAIRSDGPTIMTDCRFEENRARNGYGGAVYCTTADSLRVTDCLFMANSGVCGGALGARVIHYGYAAITGSTFTQNSASRGGAVRLILDGYVGNAILESNTFDGNTAIRCGGAIVISSNRLSIRSCSFVQNSAPTASWLASDSDYRTIVSSVFEDCLLAFNRGGSIVAPADSGWFLPSLSCCNIYGNSGGDWISYIASQADSNGNFSANPLFCDTTSGDFHLQSNSPCAPANNSCGVLIGALPVACAWGCGDIDGSGIVNITDAVRLIYYLFANGSEPLDLSGGDVNQDGHLNVADAVYLINYIFVGGPAPCAVG